jgi:hypothetical protein
MPGKSVRAAGTLLLFCWWLFCALAVAEVAARKYDVVLARSSSSPFNLGPREWAARTYRPSAELGWEHIPGTADFNSFGLPSPEYPAEKAPGTFRIVLIGDSLAAAYGPDLTYKLEDAPVAAGKTELWNLGVGGYNLAQYALALERKGLPRRPDMVLLFICLNDLNPDIPVIYKDGDSFLALQQSKPQPESLPLGGLLWPRSALYRALMVSRLMSGKTGLPEVEEAARGNLAKIKDDCKKQGIPLLAFVFPYLKPLGRYTAHEREEYRLILGLLRGAGIRHIDLHERFDPELLKLRNYPADQLHFAPEGREKAMKIVRSLIKV